MGRKSYLAFYSLFYAVIFTFSLYKNLSGITFPLFVAATLVFSRMVMSEFGVAVKKDSIFLEICSMLLGISQVLTDNEFVKAFNVIIVFGLLLIFVMHQFTDDAKWGFERYFISILDTIGGILKNIFAPLKDWSSFKKEKKDKEVTGNEFPWKKVVITVLLTIPALIVVVVLLSSADSVFGKLVERIFDFEIDGDVVGVILLTIVIFLCFYALFVYFFQKEASLEREVKKQDPVIGITIGIMFDVVYLVFSVIQILFLFVGGFSLPDGETYAEYAREGFFQLLAVCGFNLLLVVLGTLKFRQNKVLKGILLVMSGCTFIMIASSALRMILYIRYYYFTFLRVLVLWALFTITVLMIGVVTMLLKPSFNLFRYALVTVTVLYLILSFSHVDYFVAKWDYQESGVPSDFFISGQGFSDSRALAELSLDAAPILFSDAHIDDFRKHYIYFEALGNEFNVRNFNVSRYVASKLAKEQEAASAE